MASEEVASGGVIVEEEKINNENAEKILPCSYNMKDEDDVEEATETDHLSVRFQVGPKASDASSMDDLSDIEEPLKEGKCKNCRRSRACCITLYSWLALFVIACVAAIITIGVLVVAPYIKATHFLSTVCKPTRTERVGDTLACSCGKRCRSSYPCVEIIVDFTYTGLSDQQTVLHDSEAMLQRQCSFYPPCKSSRPENEKAVREYEEKYGTPGKEYPCLYNPNNPSEVIRTRRFHLEHVIHGMVWSSLVFILSLVILILAIKKKGCDFL